MKLGDIYINKENKSIVQIDSFASPMGDFKRTYYCVSSVRETWRSDWQFAKF